MDDADDAIAAAMVAQRQLAARSVVRRDEIRPQLEKLRADRAQLDALDGADAEVATLKKELDERIATLDNELALVETHLAGAQSEMASLKKLKSDLPAHEARAIAASVLEKDPFVRSSEDIALANVRQHIGDAVREADLGDELRGAAPARVPTREEKDAEARRILEELKAKRKAAPPSPEEEEPTPTRPKRTL